MTLLLYHDGPTNGTDTPKSWERQGKRYRTDPRTSPLYKCRDSSATAARHYCAISTYRHYRQVATGVSHARPHIARASERGVCSQAVWCMLCTGFFTTTTWHHRVLPTTHNTHVTTTHTLHLILHDPRRPLKYLPCVWKKFHQHRSSGTPDGVYKPAKQNNGSGKHKHDGTRRA